MEIISQTDADALHGQAATAIGLLDEHLHAAFEKYSITGAKRELLYTLICREIVQWGIECYVARFDTIVPEDIQEATASVFKKLNNLHRKRS